MATRYYFLRRSQKDVLKELEYDFILRKRKLGEVQSILKTSDGYKGYSDPRRPDGKSIEDSLTKKKYSIKKLNYQKILEFISFMTNMKSFYMSVKPKI